MKTLIKRLHTEDKGQIKLSINTHCTARRWWLAGGVRAHLGLIVNTSTDVWHTGVTGSHRDAWQKNIYTFKIANDLPKKTQHICKCCCCFFLLTFPGPRNRRFGLCL